MKASEELKGVHDYLQAEIDQRRQRQGELEAEILALVKTRDVVAQRMTSVKNHEEAEAKGFLSPSAPPKKGGR